MPSGVYERKDRPRKSIVRTCLHCLNTFNVRYPSERRKYCSLACAKAFQPALSDESVFHAIVIYKRGHDGVAPNVREIAALIDSIQATVLNSLTRLVAAGRIRWIQRRPRTIEVVGGYQSVQVTKEQADIMFRRLDAILAGPE